MLVWTFPVFPASSPQVSAMLKAKNVMANDVLTVDPDDSVREVVELLHDLDTMGLPVVNMAGQFLGMATQFDLMDLLEDPTIGNCPIYQHMTRDVPQVAEDTDVAQVAELFRDRAVWRVFVLCDDRLVGQIGRSDLFRHVLDSQSPVRSGPLRTRRGPGTRRGTRRGSPRLTV